MSPLLALPFELREQVFREVFVNASNDVQVLQVCGQIYVEAQQHIFKRPLVFNSQQDLYRWLGLVEKKNLKYVTNIRIQLVDVDLSPILGSFHQPSSTQPLYWQLYNKELDRLLSAIRALPNLREITVYGEASTRSYLYRQLYSSFLGLIRHGCPGLRRLTLHSDQQPLTFMEPMQSLRSFRFTGFSRSTPAETLAILSKLPCLNELELMGPPDRPVVPTQCGQEAHSQPRQFQSITPAVIKNLRSLTSFSISESGSLPIFFTPEFLGALHQAHRNKLRELRIHLEYTPSSDVLRTLYAFLAASSIQRVEFVWPNLTHEYLKHLPRSLKVLSLGAMSPHQACETLAELCKGGKSTFSGLQEVRLLDCCRDCGLYFDEGVTPQFALLVESLRAIGIKTLRDHQAMPLD